MKKSDVTDEFRQNRSIAQKELWRDPEYRNKLSEAHKGNIPWNKGLKTGLVPRTAFKKGEINLEKHPRYTTGISCYRKRFTEEELICSICGTHEKIVIHHKDGNRENNNIVNLVPVCHKCHRNECHEWGGNQWVKK